MLKRYERELKIRCSHKDFDLWVQQALEADMSLSDWVRRQLRSSGPVQTQVMRVPSDSAGPKPITAIPGVRTAAEAADREMVDGVEFVRPATWKLVVGGEVVWESTQKAGDPRSKNWARAELEKYCVQKDVGGFRKAWEQLESELSDGGFSL